MSLALFQEEHRKDFIFTDFCLWLILKFYTKKEFQTLAEKQTAPGMYHTDSAKRKGYAALRNLLLIDWLTIKLTKETLMTSYDKHCKL